MKILILGAGVIGTTYAWQLSNAGNDVTLFVRAEEKRKIERGGFLFDAKMNDRRNLNP